MPFVVDADCPFCGHALHTAETGLIRCHRCDAADRPAEGPYPACVVCGQANRCRNYLFFTHERMTRSVEGNRERTRWYGVANGKAPVCDACVRRSSVRRQAFYGTLAVLLTALLVAYVANDPPHWLPNSAFDRFLVVGIAAFFAYLLVLIGFLDARVLQTLGNRLAARRVSRRERINVKPGHVYDGAGRIQSLEEAWLSAAATGRAR